MTKTKRRIRRIRELRDQGKKVREIADIMKISESYVGKLITKAGLAQTTPEPVTEAVVTPEPEQALPGAPELVSEPSPASASQQPILVKLLRSCPNPKFWEADLDGVKVKCRLRKLQDASFLKKGMHVKVLEENGLYKLWT